MKRSFCLAAVLLAITAFTFGAGKGQGSSQSASGNVKKIRFSSFQTGDVEKDWVEVQFPRFQKEKGIMTEHVFIAQADTIATIMTWTAAGTAPDAAMLSAN